MTGFGGGSNLPPGTWEGDPRAPWNAPDPPEVECDCGHLLEQANDGTWSCPNESCDRHGEKRDLEGEAEDAAAEAAIARAEALRDDPPEPPDDW